MSADKTVVVKIGTSSITDSEGVVQRSRIAKLCAEVADLRAAGYGVVVVTSGAIAAGLPELGLGGGKRPRDIRTLQAVATVGQSALMAVYREEFASHGLIAGQVLLIPLDFIVRSQYLHARQTLERLLELGVIPVVNENDAIADDEIRFGDNDRIAALVANLVDAVRLVLLTDTPGVLTADPRTDADASLIEEIVRIDHQTEALVGGAGSARGSGGMASKLNAAKIAAWSGVSSVIADAHRDHVLRDSVEGVAGSGTMVHARKSRLPARKLWIAFAVGAQGTITVDGGARKALERGKSLLSAGVRQVDGSFAAGSPVEVVDDDAVVFAKGLTRHGSDDLRAVAGRRSDDLGGGALHLVIHADDLVTVPA